MIHYVRIVINLLLLVQGENMIGFQPKIYGAATINDKGQVVIPAEARAELGLEPGTRVMIMTTPFGGSVAVVSAKVIEEQANLWKGAKGMTDEVSNE